MRLVGRRRRQWRQYHIVVSGQQERGLHSRWQLAPALRQLLGMLGTSLADMCSSALPLRSWPSDLPLTCRRASVSALCHLASSFRSAPGTPERSMDTHAPLLSRGLLLAALLFSSIAVHAAFTAPCAGVAKAPSGALIDGCTEVSAGFGCPWHLRQQRGRREAGVGRGAGRGPGERLRRRPAGSAGAARSRRSLGGKLVLQRLASPPAGWCRHAWGWKWR